MDVSSTCVWCTPGRPNTSANFRLLQPTPRIALVFSVDHNGFDRRVIEASSRQIKYDDNANETVRLDVNLCAVLVLSRLLQAKGLRSITGDHLKGDIGKEEKMKIKKRW